MPFLFGVELMALLRWFLKMGWIGLAAWCCTVAASGSVWDIIQDNSVWRAECGTCHTVFPPGLLSSDDWLDLMSRLDRHFGVDATLDAQVKAEISQYLVEHSARSRSFGDHGEAPRITTTDRFVRKHRSAIRLWLKGQIQTLSDCAACHKETGVPISR